MSDSQREELAALDRILAREPVGERHLELAALVDSVRAGAPRIDPAFAQRLDTQIEQRLAGRRRFGGRRPRISRPAMRRLALAGGGLVAAAVAFTIVISGGLLNGATKTPGNVQASGRTLSPAAKAPVAGHAAPALPRATATTSAPPSAGAVATPGANYSGVTASGTATRLVRRGSTLTLASPPSAMQGVANQIVAATEQDGGVVETSNVNIQGRTSYASFSLEVPSGRLGSLIATLSALAGVRSLTQSTHDITGSYNQETARLADSVAEHAALLKKLATAATLTAEMSLQKQIAKLEARITAEHRVIASLLNEGHNATLQVNVVAATAKHSSAVGPLSRSFHNALHALVDILAIALIALAIILPFALSALVLWWGAANVRQRARERAMGSA